MQGQYSLRSPAVKRLMKEAQELSDATAQFHAQPLEDNLFEWHFTIRGPDDSEFADGIYHGRIILPPDYPMKPPSIIVLTSNGRFETYTKICLSISGHHPESWQPSWSIRTALLAIIGFMPTHGGGAIGSLDYTPEERKRLAKKSQDFKCPQCGHIRDILRPVSEASKADTEEAKELASQINFQGEKKTPIQQQSSSASSKSDVSSTASSGPSSPPSPSPQLPPGAAPSPPWQGLPNQIPSGMPRFPFMPFMPRPATSASSTASQSQAAMHFSQMAAMQAAMQQHMRAQSSRFPAWGQQTNMGMFAAQRPQTGTSAPRPMPQPMPQTSNPATTSSTTTKPATSTAEANSTNSTAASAEAQRSNQTGAEANSTNSAAASTESKRSNQTGAEAAPTATSGTEGLRQRAAPSSTSTATPPRSPRVSTTRRSAEIPRRSQQARPSSVVTTVLIVIVAVAFFALLLRRLSLMGVIRYDQDADL